jgi:hypothetical protein
MYPIHLYNKGLGGICVLHLHDYLIIHHMTKGIGTPARRTTLNKITGIILELVRPPFGAITASTLLRSLPTRCWRIAVGTCFNSATSISEVGH